MTPCKHCGEIESRHCINWPHPYKLCDLVHGHGYEAARCVAAKNRFGFPLNWTAVRVADCDSNRSPSMHGPTLNADCDSEEHRSNCLHHDPVYETATVEAEKCGWSGCGRPADSIIHRHVTSCGPHEPHADCHPFVSTRGCERLLADIARPAPSVPPEPPKVETCGAVFGTGSARTLDRGDLWHRHGIGCPLPPSHEGIAMCHPFGYRPPQGKWVCAPPHSVADGHGVGCVWWTINSLLPLKPDGQFVEHIFGAVTFEPRALKPEPKPALKRCVDCGGTGRVDCNCTPSHGVRGEHICRTCSRTPEVEPPKPKPAFWRVCSESGEVTPFIITDEKSARYVAECRAKEDPGSNWFILPATIFCTAEPQSVKWHGGGE